MAEQRRAPADSAVVQEVLRAYTASEITLLVFSHRMSVLGYGLSETTRLVKDFVENKGSH